jgi:glycosyltransferase involved in cell wall biosynthesis
MLHPHDIFSASEPWTIRIVSLAKEFKDKGHEVKLAYCPLFINEEKWAFDLEGIEIVSLNRIVGLWNLFYNLQKIKELTQWADIIHFQKCFHYISFPALICGWLLNKPLHYDWDDWEEKIWYHSNSKSIHTLIFGNFIKLLERIIPVLVDTISVSSSKLEELCLSFGVQKNRIFKAPVGADLKKFNPTISSKELKRKYNLDSKMTILYLGQLHGAQYVNIFIEAASLVLLKHPDTIFLIVGQGYMLNQLKELVARFGIADSVIFTGSVPHSLVPEYIAAADICVACFENNELTVCKSPLKVVEYLASGKPIVASSVGEIPNMVGDAGLLAEPGNHRLLAEAIVNLIENPQLRQEMSFRARQRAEVRYNWGKTAENLLRAYEKNTNFKGTMRYEVKTEGLGELTLKNI